MNASFQSLLNYGEGRMKATVALFFSSLGIFLLGCIITLGIGGAIGIAIGLTLSIISFIFLIAFGIMSYFIYWDWINNS